MRDLSTTQSGAAQSAASKIFRQKFHRRFSTCLTVAMLVATLGACRNDEAEVKNAAPPPATVSIERAEHLDSDRKLFFAASTGNIELATQAIAEGANVNVTDRLSRTPLIVAAFGNQPAMVKLLIDRGGDVNAKDFDGLSPLHAATIVGSHASALALLQHGADINSRNVEGSTALYLAVATKRSNMVTLLVQHGADQHLGNNDGSTPASLAARLGIPGFVAPIAPAKPLR